MRTVDIAIGEHRFKLTSLPGYEALVVHQRLLRHAVPGIAAMQALFPNGKATRLDQIDLTKLSGAAADLLAALPEENFLALCDKLLAGAVVVDQKNEGMALSNRDVFNTVFCENVEAVYVLLWEAVKLNYSRFLGRLQSGLNALPRGPIPATTQSLSDSLKTSGSSGSPTG